MSSDCAGHGKNCPGANSCDEEKAQQPCPYRRDAIVKSHGRVGVIKSQQRSRNERYRKEAQAYAQPDRAGRMFLKSPGPVEQPVSQKKNALNNNDEANQSTTISHND